MVVGFLIGAAVVATFVAVWRTQGAHESPSKRMAELPVDTPRANLAVICAIFFCSGIPALIYQLGCQRSLFTIYGINVESVTRSRPVTARPSKPERNLETREGILARTENVPTITDDNMSAEWGPR
jgi:hypothetical protein